MAHYQPQVGDDVRTILTGLTFNGRTIEAENFAIVAQVRSVDASKQEATVEFYNGSENLIRAPKMITVGWHRLELAPPIGGVTRPPQQQQNPSE